MTQETVSLKVVQEQLQTEKEKLEETLSSLAAQDPYANPDRIVDNAASDTEASEESSHERVQALKDELQAHLSDIDETLTRIANGSYGQCTQCEAVIAPDRLKIRPTARYCVSCAQKNER